MKPRTRAEWHRLLGKLLKVTWLDATGAQLDEKDDTHLDLSIVETVGWLHAFNEKAINLVMGRSKHDGYNHFSAIPRATIEEVRLL